jgi:hypothetical protein
VEEVKHEDLERSEDADEIEIVGTKPRDVCLLAGSGYKALQMGLSGMQAKSPSCQ